MEWISTGRDIHITEPILSFLEFKYDLKIVRSSIWDGLWKIIKHRPKILLIANTTGAHENFNLTKIAYKLGIKVVSLVSEGDYRESKNEVLSFFWGWNSDKFFYEDLRLMWSNRTLNLVSEHISNAKKYNLQLSGATGFDRYKILKFPSKADFLLKYNKIRYNRVVGFAGWGFDRYTDSFSKQIESDKGLKSTISDTDMDQRYFFNESCRELNKILHLLVKNNPEVLFILKYHPGTVNRDETEFVGLDKYANTLNICREEDISTVISASDIWLAFESTSCLEAWLLGKQTALINPCGSNFSRSKIALGSPIYKTFEETNQAIVDYFENSLLPGFNKYDIIRKNLISDIIGFDDGKNHIRAGEFIVQILNSEIKRKKTIDFNLLALIIKDMLKLLIFNTPFGFIKRSSYKFYKDIKKQFSNIEREKIRNEYYIQLKQFYKSGDFTI